MSELVEVVRKSASKAPVVHPSWPATTSTDDSLTVTTAAFGPSIPPPPPRISMRHQSGVRPLVTWKTVVDQNGGLEEEVNQLDALGHSCISIDPKLIALRIHPSTAIRAIYARLAQFPAWRFDGIMAVLEKMKWSAATGRKEADFNAGRRTLMTVIQTLKKEWMSRPNHSPNDLITVPYIGMTTQTVKQRWQDEDAPSSKQRSLSFFLHHFRPMKIDGKSIMINNDIILVSGLADQEETLAAEGLLAEKLGFFHNLCVNRCPCGVDFCGGQTTSDPEYDWVLNEETNQMEYMFISKICTKCNQRLLAEKFHRHSYAIGGRTTRWI